MRVLNIAISVFFVFIYTFADASPESIAEKERMLREGIKKKDQERREQILKKFYDFQNKVKNFAPDFKIQIPVDPSVAEDIKDQDHSSETSEGRGYRAYAADSYMLRALPYDSEKEYTAAVKRGDSLTVVMKPVVEKRKDKPSITKDWLLVKTPDGTEGYIPQNMVLKNKPGRDGNSGTTDDPSSDEDTVIAMYDMDGSYSDFSPVTPGAGFTLVQYPDGGGDAKRMKVNTQVLKVRGEPSLNGEVVGSLAKNDEVEVIEYSENEDYYQGRTSKWARIKSDGIEGWVFAIYLSEIDGSADTGKNEPAEYLKKGKELYVKPDILRVRDAPDEMGTVLFSLQNKDSVKITDIEEEAVTLGGKRSLWVKVKFLDYEGWVFGAFLSDSRSAFEEGDDINNIFQVPISEDSYFISSKYGKRILKGKVSNHTGIDFATSCGNAVSAASDGTVIMAVTDDRNCSSCGYGSYVIIEHKNGYRTVYGHLSSVKVSVGKKISSGEKIGTVGNTGHSYGCHLHFEIRAYEEFVDPMNYMHP